MASIFIVIGSAMETFVAINPNAKIKQHNFHVVSHHVNSHMQGPYFPITKVTIQALPQNKKVIWVSQCEPASDQNGLPLFPGDTVILDNILNLNEVFLFFKIDWDKVLMWVCNEASDEQESADPVHGN